MNTAQSEDMDLDHEDLFLDFPGPRTLCCTSCRKKIKCLTKLKEHFQEHTFPMIIPLDTTDYSRPKLAGSSEHMSPCQLARFQCSKCPASFTLKSNMEQHGKKKPFQLEEDAVPSLPQIISRQNRLKSASYIYTLQLMSFFVGRTFFGTWKNLITHKKRCTHSHLKNVYKILIKLRNKILNKKTRGGMEFSSSDLENLTPQLGSVQVVLHLTTIHLLPLQWHRKK